MILLLLLGLAVGVVSTLLGIGGGVFLVPFLPALTGWNGHQVVVIALIVILGNSLFNLWAYNKQGMVNWDVLRFWGPLAAIGSFIGSYGALKFSEKTLQIVLLSVVFLMILKFSSDFFKNPRKMKLFTSSNWHPLKSFYGLFVGTLSGFCGVGTGLVSSLFFMSRRWVEQEEVSPTGNGVMFFVSLSSVISFMIFGGGRSVDLSFLSSSSLQVGILIASVYVTSYFLRPMNSFISGNLRFMGLMGSLLFVFGYVSLNLMQHM